MKICVECSGGGHLTEMQMLLEAFESHDFFFVTTRALTTKNLWKKARTYYVRNQYQPKSRAHALLVELCHLIKVTFLSAKILIREKPEVIVTTGGEATIPFCYIGKMLGAKIIYISSLARVHALPFTGKIVYPIADLFLVQWEYLSRRYPKAQYWGKVI